ncbi:MAG: hypothetical protein JWL64_2430, partial [Frankiales bacterium]|nr:hypothetical protein [Frankiales bacterium]
LTAWLTVAVLAVVLLTACGVSAEDRPRAIAPSAIPPALATSSPPATVPSGPQSASVYLVRDRLLVARPRNAPTSPTVGTLLQLLLAGPTEAERTAGLTSTVPPDVTVSVVLTDGGIATVTVPGNDAPSRLDENLGFGQIVLTLSQSPRVRGVVFRRNDNALDVPRADGSISKGPFVTSDFNSLVR